MISSDFERRRDRAQNPRMFNPNSSRIEQKPVCTFPTTKVKNISCVFCRHQFYIRDLSHLKGVFLPMVLRCGHASCQQCAAAHRGDVCPLCKTSVDFDTSEEENLPAANVYVIGLLGVARGRPVNCVEPDIDFSQAMRIKQQSAKQASCFKCSAPAELKCLKCHDLLCHQCSSKIHDKLKAQGQTEEHFRVMLTDSSRSSLIEIPTCIQHGNAVLDYYCEDCERSGCAYCMCDYHKPHKTLRQSIKNEEYMEEFQRAHDKLAESLQRIRQAQKKLQKTMVFPAELQNSETIEAAINQHFVHLHGVLQNIESDLIKQLYEQRNDITRNLMDIQQRLKFQEEEVQSGLLLAASVNEIRDRVSLKDVIARFEELMDLPCHLVENPGITDAKIIFTCAASIVERLANHCQLSIPKTEAFDLFRRDELPMGYQIEPVSVEEFQRTLEKTFSTDASLMGTSSCQSLSSSRRSEGPAVPKSGCIVVHVAYIESPANFYVRRATHKNEILRLEDEVMNYAELKGRVPQTVQPNNIYAVRRTGGKWFRGRVKAINTSHGNPDTYEIFHMDYGKTESRVTKSRLRCLPDNLTSIPQYVTNCAIDDIVPTHGVWGKDVRRKMTEFFKTPEGRTANVYMYTLGSKNSTELVDLCLVPTRDGEGKQISVRDKLIFSGLGKLVSSQYLLRTIPQAVRGFFREELALDTYHTVNCSHVESPDCIFVQKTGENLAHLWQLTTDMGNTYNANSKKERLMVHGVPEIGMPCAIEKSKGAWYRAVVCGIPAPQTVELFLVDFGAKLTTQYEKIRKLRENHMITAGQAIRISLADIKPEGTEWSESAIEFTRRSIQENEVHIIAFEKSQSSYSVALYLNGDTNFAAVLVNGNHAVSTGIRSSGVAATARSQPNTQNQSGKVRNARTVKKKKSQKHLSELSIKSGAETTITTESADPYRVRVKIIRVVSPSAIYLADPSHDAEYEEMMRQMQTFYNQYGDAKGSVDWQPDLPCVVYSTCDRLYCRGKIVAIEAKEAQVFLYDLGHTINVPVGDLQSLKRRFWRTPTYVFKVKLAGILPCGGSSEWAKTSCQMLKDIVIENQNKKFYISKVESPDDGDLYVELWVEQVKYPGPLLPAVVEVNSINRMLVDEGLALPIKRHNEKKITLAVELKRQISGADHERRDEDFKFAGMEEEEGDDNLEKNSPAPSECTLVSDDEAAAPASSWLPADKIAEDTFLAEPTYLDHDCVVHVHSVAHSQQTLRSIEATLQSEYPKLKEKPRDRGWKVGDWCIAPYHAEKKCYRAEIRSVLPYSIQVEFVDYGNVEQVEPDELRLPETRSGKLAMTRIPRQKTKCVIDGLHPNPPTHPWKLIDLDAIHLVLVNKQCEISVKRRTEDYLVVSIFLLNPRRELIQYLRDETAVDIWVEYNHDATYNNETILDDSSNSDDNDNVVIDGYIIGDEKPATSAAPDKLDVTKIIETDGEENSELPKIDENDDADVKVVEDRKADDSDDVEEVDKTATNDLDSGKICKTDGKTIDINYNETDDSVKIVDEINLQENKIDKAALKEKIIVESDSDDSNAKQDLKSNVKLNDEEFKLNLEAKVAADAADLSVKILNESSAKEARIIECNESADNREDEPPNDVKNESAPIVESPTLVSAASRLGKVKFSKDVPVYNDESSTDSDDLPDEECAAEYCRYFQDTVLSGTANFTRSAGDIESSLEEAMERLEVISLPDDDFLKHDDLVTSTPMNETIDCGVCLPYKPIVFPDSVKVVKAVRSVIGRTDCWLHLLDNKNSEVLSEARAKYERIIADMQKRASKQPILENYKTGSPCCVKFKDGLWCRCFVADPDPYMDGDIVKVTFGDWGNSQHVAYYELREMKDEWLDAPFMSLRCKLWGVKEARGNDASQFSAKLRKAYEDKIIYVELMTYANHSYEVQLYNDEDCKELIYDSLIEEGFFVKNPTTRTV